jgi:GNAT superfamily N-acetyltransferase
MPPIQRARSESDFRQVENLFLTYRDYLMEIDCMDGGGYDIEREVKDLSSVYAAENEGIFLLWEGEEAVACGALADFHGNGEVAEIRRIYVAESHRRKGYARAMMEHLVAFARKQGYRKIYLDTFRSFSQAKGLYESLGFYEIPPYYAGPAHKLYFMECSL